MTNLMNSGKPKAWKESGMMAKEINTVYRLIQVLATFNPDMQVMIKQDGAVNDDMGWIDRVGAEKHEGEWFAVIHVEENP